MNQVLKDVVYGKGNMAQASFMADIGGMNEEERKVFYLIHKGFPDAVIQSELNLSRKSYERIEEAVRAKLLLAVFHCINKAMDQV